MWSQTIAANHELLLLVEREYGRCGSGKPDALAVALQQFLGGDGVVINRIVDAAHRCIESDLWESVYDWHVRHQLPLSLSRRYAMTVAFTTLVLRPDASESYVGPGVAAR